MEQDFPLEINYKTFYLRPDTPPEGIVRQPRDGAEPGSLLTGNLGEAAIDAGLVMRRSPITPNSALSFEASEFAKDKGLFEPFHKACYKVFWEEGVNLGELSVLQDIGKQVGLDAQEMKERLDSGYYTPRQRPSTMRPLPSASEASRPSSWGATSSPARSPTMSSSRWRSLFRRRRPAARAKQAEGTSR